jgi:hypothetical protein
MADAQSNLGHDRLAVPIEYAAQIQALGEEVLRLIDTRPLDTVKLSREQLELLKRAEVASGKPLHKGQPLHNLGVAQFVSDPKGARILFAAAYVEDARLNPSGPVESLASSALHLGYDYTKKRLAEIATLARQASDVGPIDLVSAKDGDYDFTGFRLPWDSPDDENRLEGLLPSQLVFVGGSYRYGWGRILAMAWAVRRAGRRPVVVSAFPDRSGESPRMKSLRLLDKCGICVFDGTEPVNPGWWTELERVAQAPRPTLLAFSSDDPKRAYEGSGMLPTKQQVPELAYLPFQTEDRLSAGVLEWLLLMTPVHEPATGPGRSVAFPSGEIEWAMERFSTGSNTGYMPGASGPAGPLASEFLPNREPERTLPDGDSAGPKADRHLEGRGAT